MITFKRYLLEKKGLWDNIHAKRKRIKQGSGERMRKPGSKGAPTNQDFKDASESTLYESSDRASHFRALAKSHSESEGDHQDKHYDHADASENHGSKILKSGAQSSTGKWHSKGRDVHDSASQAHQRAANVHVEARDNAKAAAAAHEKYGPDHPDTKRAENRYSSAARTAKATTKAARESSAAANQHSSNRPTNESTLDEISDKALDAYRKAATKSYRKSTNYFSSPSYEKNPKTVAKHSKNREKRAKGLGSANKRDLAKSSGQTYVHKPTYTKGLIGGNKADAPQLTTKRVDQLHKRYKDR